MQDFGEFIAAYQQLMRTAANIPITRPRNCPVWPLMANSTRVLIVSAHPDDEILTGMPMGLRYKEAGATVTNLAVTLGRPEQAHQRRGELQGACEYLGVELRVPLENGLRTHIKSQNPVLWEEAVNATYEIIAEIKPQVIITHHGDDGHPDHCATNRLTVQALQRIPEFSCIFIQGEYWRDIPHPNLQLEVSVSHLEYLLNALSFHVGELSRNRYDLFWAPFMHLNSRYSEVVLGWGTSAATFDFSVMYEVQRFEEKRLRPCIQPVQCRAQDNVLSVVPL